MELWIRSQDKENLLKVNEIHLGLNKEYVNSNIVVNDWIVGRYETKKRALEVLDEIQNILQPTVIYKEPKIDYDDDNFIQQISQNILVHSTQQVEMELKQAGQIVYEMPSE